MTTCWPLRGRRADPHLRRVARDRCRTHDPRPADRGGRWRHAERAIGALPAESRSFIDAISPIRHVDGLRTDVYLMHDTADHHVPFVESRSLASALASRRPARTLRIPPLRPRAARRRRLPRRRPGARQAPAPRANPARGDPLATCSEEGERAEDQQPRRPPRSRGGRPTGSSAVQGLVRAPAASLGPAHAALHVRRNRNGVVSASRLDTDRSCLRVRFRSLPW